MKNSLKPPDYSDAGAAEVFSATVKRSLRWCNSQGWLFWNGQVWEIDDTAALRLAIDFSEKMKTEALTLYKQQVKYDHTGKPTVPADIDGFMKFAGRLRNESKLSAMLNLSKAYLSIKGSELDRNWHELNTPAGIYDLRTKQIKPHDSLSYHTKITACSPSLDGMEEWLAFLDMFTSHDEGKKQFLQIKAGADLYGKCLYEAMQIDVGGGRNGKSTYENSRAKVLGAYAASIDSKVLTTERQNRGAAFASLRGLRLVLAGELEEGSRLSISTLKQLCSTDLIPGERKYHDPESFPPSHHLVLFTNFFPKIGSQDSGTWRRLIIVPCTAEMPRENAEIMNYADLLFEKAGGAILDWMLEGAKLYAENAFRLEFPESIRKAADSYKQSEDWLSQFLNECCIISPNGTVRCGALYQRYKTFCASNGDYCRRNSDFVNAMHQFGFNQISRGGNKKSWLGVTLDDAEIYAEQHSAYAY